MYMWRTPYFHYFRTIGKNPLDKWIGVIRRGYYQEADEDRIWSYEPVSDLWPYIEPYSDSSVDGSID